MFLHVRTVKYLEAYRLWLEFNNGESGEIDLNHALYGEVFEPLHDLALFATAAIDAEMETVTWANGADLAPEYLLDLMRRQHKKAA